MAENDEDLEVKANSLKDYLNENKKAKNILGWIWSNFLSSKGKKLALQIFILMLIVQFLGVFNAYAVRYMIDGLVILTKDASKNYSTFIFGFITFAVILLLGRLVNWKKGILREYFFDDFGEILNHKVCSLFFAKSLGTHVSENNVLNESNVKKGYDRVFDLVYLVMFEAIEIIIALIFSYVLIWPIHWGVGLIITAMILVHLIWSGFLNFRAMKDGYPIEKGWRFLYRYRVERWQHIERVKNNAKEEDEIKALSAYYRRTGDEDLKLWTWYVRLSSMRGIVTAAIFLVAIYYGFDQIIQGKLSLGWAYPILAFCSQILDNFWRVGDLERKIHYNLHNVGILKEALELPSGISFSSNPIVLPKGSPCRIEFEGVSYKFGDDPRTPPVLSDITFTIEPNEAVAIIGTSGAGKSTLMRLLLRYMDPKQGCIKIDGYDLRDISLESWLDMVGFIAQKPQPLNGTLRYNALYNCRDTGSISDEYLWEQARIMQVDFEERLIDGLDTKIGYGGIELSGGQNQRLMILAAVLKNPRFLVIDEATSSLDSSTEKLVQEGIQKALSRDCGALIVAHRLSTVRKCNKFIVIEPVNGSGSKVVGIGMSFEELYKTCPQFRKLADDQEIRI